MEPSIDFSMDSAGPSGFSDGFFNDLSANVDFLAIFSDFPRICVDFELFSSRFSQDAQRLLSPLLM